MLRLILEPLLSNEIGFPVTAEEINYSPFTSILKLKNVKVGYQDTPFVEGQNGICKIDNLLGLLSQKIQFSDLNLDGITFRAVRSEDGKWNFPWMYTDEKDFEEPPVILNLRNINIKNGEIVYEIRRKSPGHSSKVSFYNLDVKTPLFAGNHQTEIKYKGLVKISSGKTVKVQEGFISGSLSSYFDEWIIPQSLISNFDLSKAKGNINKLSIGGNSVNFSTDIIAKNNIININNVSLTEKQKNKITTEIILSGHLNENFESGELNLKAIPVSTEVLNLLSGVFVNYNFGNMKIYYDGNINYSPDSLLNIGKLIINNFQINKNKEYTDTVKIPYDISLDYTLEYTGKSNILCLKNLDSFFSKNLIDNEDKFNFNHPDKALTLSIAKPVFFKFTDTEIDLLGEKTKGKIALNNLDIRFLNSFLVDLPNIRLFSGLSNGVFNFTVNPEKNDFFFKGKFDTEKLSLQFGEYQFNDIDITQDFECTLNDFKYLELNPFSANIFKNKDKILKTVINGEIDLSQQILNLKVALPMMKNTVLDIFPGIIKNNSFINEVLSKLTPFRLTAFTNLYLNLIKQKGSIGNAKLTLNTEKYKNAVLQLKNYIPFTWNKNNYEFKENIETNFNIEELNLKFFNSFFNSSDSFYFTDGIVNSTFNCLFSKDFSKITINGNSNFPSFSINYNDNDVHNIDAVASYEIDFNNIKNTASLKKMNLILDTNNTNALSLTSYGLYNLNEKTLKLSSDIFNITKNILDFFPAVNTENINSLKADGKTNMFFSPLNITLNGIINLKKMSYHSTLKSKNISPYDKGSIQFNISANNKKLSIEEFLINLTKNNKPLLHSSFKGHCPIPVNSGKSRIKVKSNILNPKLLLELKEAFSKPEKTEAVKENKILPAQKPPVKRKNTLNNVDFSAEIDLNNIVLTSKAKAELKAAVNLKNNNLSINKFNGNINKSPFKGSFSLNLTDENVYPYNLNLKCAYIKMPDLFSMFAVENNKLQGNVNNIEIQFTGVNLPFSESQNKILKGYIKADAKALKIPAKLSGYSIFKIMFIPLELLGRVRKIIPVGLTSESIKNALVSTSKIFTGMSEVTFNKAEIYILANNNLQLEKVIFTGGPDDFVKLMKFTGKIDLNKFLDIEAYSNVSGIRFPLQIHGTLDKPVTNTQKFIYDFLKDNTLNILNPKNVIDLFTDIGKGIENTILSIFN